MGTPHFAVSSLNALLKSEHEIIAVYTRADKPRGRGKQVTFSPVKEVALAHNIPVEQPTTLRTSEALETLCSYNPDCIAVIAYGMIIPQKILDLPKYGCLNVHASLLPKYRGAAPINRCIMNGENESGVTIMQMDAGIDTGDMLLTECITIGDDMTATHLHDELAEIGGRLLVQALDNIDTLTPVKQNDSDSTYAEKLTKAECELDLTKPAKVLYNHIRGLADYPCAYTFYGDKRLKIYRAVIGEHPLEGIILQCSDSAITLTDVQPEGGKRMKAAEFLRGSKV
jgi:methionyl-tRNA formyltransferase